MIIAFLLTLTVGMIHFFIAIKFKLYETELRQLHDRRNRKRN